MCRERERRRGNERLAWSGEAVHLKLSRNPPALTPLPRCKPKLFEEWRDASFPNPARRNISTAQLVFLTERAKATLVTGSMFHTEALRDTLARDLRGWHAGGCFDTGRVSRAPTVVIIRKVSEHTVIDPAGAETIVS